MSIYQFNLKKEEEEQIKAELEQEETPEQKEYVTAEMVGAFLGTVFAAPLVLMLSWNWSLPALFGIKAINYFQAICLVAIVRILKG